MPLLLAVGEPPENTLFSFKKRNSAGGNKKIGKGFFWWGAARLAVLGGVATHFAGNGFERGRIAVPNNVSGFYVGYFIWQAIHGANLDRGSFS